MVSAHPSCDWGRWGECWGAGVMPGRWPEPLLPPGGAHPPCTAEGRALGGRLWAGRAREVIPGAVGKTDRESRNRTC